MIAVIVNCGAIILGSILGLLFAKKFTEELSEMIQTACGVITIVIGLQMAFKYDNIIFLALSLIIGGVIGYLIDIDGAVLKLGKKLAVLTKSSESLQNQFLTVLWQLVLPLLWELELLFLRSQFLFIRADSRFFQSG